MAKKEKVEYKCGDCRCCDPARRWCHMFGGFVGVNNKACSDKVFLAESRRPVWKDFKLYRMPYMLAEAERRKIAELVPR